MLFDLVRAAAEHDPDHPAVIAAGRTTTYGALAERAEALGRGIDAAGLARFGCRVGDAAQLLALLAGASAVDAEPCVYPAGVDADELAARFDHAVVVTDEPDAAPRRVTIDGLATPGAALAPPSGPGPLLVLTTGTTGAPKGARHEWRRLVAGLRTRELTPEQRWLLAYNLNQFAGLQVLLHVVARSATLVVPASNQPPDGLRAMEEHGVTHASATPTFWRVATAMLDEAAAARIPLRQITLGGEASPGPLLDRLQQLFPAARISHVYASTEFGSGVSVRDRQAGLPVSVLDRGSAAGVEYRIVDGQLEARSTVGMLGYYGQDDVGGDWRPTGDLVEVHDDRIVFMGRIDDTINVGGVKVNPLPIEEIVTAVPGVALARVYGRSNPMTGQIVAVDVVARRGVDTDALDDAIRAACAGLPSAAQPRRVRFVDELELRGGKVVRSEASGG